MKDKKNIERLFQETFKDFESTPNEKVWGNIQRELEKKKRDRKIIPIWFRYGGVAAVLLLFFVVGKSLFFENNSSLPDNTITDTEKIVPVQDDSSNINEEVVHSDDKNKLSPESNNSTNVSESGIANTESESGETETENTKSDFANPSLKGKQNTAITQGNESKVRSSNKSNLSNASSTNSNTSLAATKDSNNQDSLNGQADENQINNGQIALNPQNQTDFDSNKNVAEKSDLNSIPSDKNNAVAEINKTEETIEDKEISEEIALVEELPKDSLTIEEAIAKTEDINDEEEKLVNRWQVYANVAPVYYNTLGEGSHLHEQFVHNPKNGEVNTSYGVKVGYALNDRFTIRTGFNALDLSYSTADVILYQSPAVASNQSFLRNVDVVATNSDSNIGLLSSDNFLGFQSSSIIENSPNSSINQTISYYEVPVEMEYNLINRRIDFQIIGGFSTFFVGKNEVFYNTNGQESYLGEANNINDVSFSANLGLGLDYNFSQKFKFNLEPVFKYQLNAYSNTSGNFRPYILGVYTGFSYKF